MLVIKSLIIRFMPLFLPLHFDLFVSKMIVDFKLLSPKYMVEDVIEALLTKEDS